MFSVKWSDVFVVSNGPVHQVSNKGNRSGVQYNPWLTLSN